VETQIERMIRLKDKRHERQMEETERAYLAFIVARDVAENWPKIEKERKGA
jgi:hypothetical protein